MNDDEADDLLGDLCDELNGIAVDMRRRTYEQLLAALDDVRRRYQTRLAGHAAGHQAQAEQRLLARRIAEWRYHFSDEHDRPTDECEQALREILATGDDIEENADFMGAFGRLCRRRGEPERGLLYVEQALRLVRATEKDYPERLRQLASLEEIARLCRGASA